MAGRGRQLEKVETPFPNVVLVLFQNSPYWWIRFWEKGKRQSFFRSTETVDQDKAMAVLPEIYQQFLIDPDAFRNEQKHTVTQLIDLFSDYHEQRVKRKEITASTWEVKRGSLKNGMLAYMIDFSLLRVKELNFKKDFMGYFQWRKAQGYKHSSIGVEVKIIKEFANWLHKNGYIKEAICNIPIPRMTHELKDLEDDSAKAFTEDQVESIRNEITKRVEESTGAERGKWLQVLFYFEMMLEGGFRTDELWHVEFRDVKQLMANGECHLDVRISKTGRRQSVLMTNTIPLIKKFLESKGVKVEGSTSFWLNTGTHNIWTKQFFTRRFRLVLDELGMGLEHRLYSCRATHITRAIKKKSSIYLLSKNLGTSEFMINRYYEDVQVKDLAQSLLYSDQGVDGFNYKERQKQQQVMESFIS